MREWLSRARPHRVAVLVALILCWFWSTRLTGSPVCCDAYDTLRMAVSLVHGGVMSLDVAPPYAPSMYREPLPVLTDAVMVAVVDAVTGRAELAAYLGGERARWIKSQNVLWLLLLCVVTYITITAFTGSTVLAIGGAILTQAVFFQGPTRAWGVDSLYTEIPAAAMLMLGSLLIARGVSRPRWDRMGLVGISFGVVALIKAAALYVFGGLVVAVAVLWAARLRRVALRRDVAGVAMLVLGCGVVVAPWLLRNYQTFGRLGISDRGGMALWMRAVMSEGIWPSQVRGSFYAWAPSVLRPAIGAVTGFGPADLRRGGRLEQLSTFADSGFLAQDRAAMFQGRPQDAVSYFYRSIAELTMVDRQLAAAGVAHSRLAADEMLMRRALAHMRAHPLESLAMTVPFLWRGAILTFPVLVAGLGWALWGRHDEFLMFCLPAFGLVMFHALLSPFEPRHGLTVFPVAIVAASVLARSLRTRRPRATEAIGAGRSDQPDIGRGSRLPDA